MSADTQLDLLAEPDILEDSPEAERARILAAIHADANSHAGWIDSNRIRDALSDATGLTVDARRLSSVYQSLAASHAIYRHNGPEWWTTSTDTRGGNAGKQIRLWRRVGAE